MTVGTILGWFTLGFAVAAVLLYGPVMAKAYWVKARAISMMSDSNKKLRESTEKEKKYAGWAQEVNEALKKEFEAKTELVKAAVERGELLEKHLALQDEHAALMQGFIEMGEEYTALLKKTGGNAEGTA